MVCASIKQGFSQHKAGKNLLWHQSFTSHVYSEGSFVTPTTIMQPPSPPLVCGNMKKMLVWFWFGGYMSDTFPQCLLLQHHLHQH